jgi:hypothetical protein
MADEPARHEAEADQSEERQREIENLGEARFHPPEKKQENESGGRSEKRQKSGKTGQQTLPFGVFTPL